MSTSPTATPDADIQKESGNDGDKPPRKLSITIPTGTPPPAADSEATTIGGDLLDLHSSAHTSPTVAPNSPLDMKIGNAQTSGSTEEASPQPTPRPDPTPNSEPTSEQDAETNTEEELDTQSDPSPADSVTELDSPPSSTSTLASPPSPSLDAIMKCITGMRQLAQTMDSTFEAFTKQTEQVANLAPAAEAAHRLKNLQRTFAEQSASRKKRITDMQQRFKDVVPQLVEEYEAKVDGIIQDIVSEEIELEEQLPVQLRSGVELHERQLLEVESKLHNSEARRFNASLATQENLMVPLRPLLVPLPTPEQSPAYIRSPMFTPITAAPGAPLPTPATAFPPSGPRSALVRSSLFPRDLNTLLGYSAQDARRLLADYGLIEQDELNTPTSASGTGSLQTPNTPTNARNKPKNAANAETTAEDGNREAHISRFMAHIGVPVKMIPNPSIKPGAKPGRPTLRVIITSPTGL
ncbi:hypothetical protein ONZ45_g8892 [Pleurotus djamor]|nr:hypothetical protein ONZ45_g8892 [Pleurotus djamor]